MKHRRCQAVGSIFTWLQKKRSSWEWSHVLQVIATVRDVCFSPIEVHWSNVCLSYIIIVTAKWQILMLSGHTNTSASCTMSYRSKLTNTSKNSICAGRKRLSKQHFLCGTDPAGTESYATASIWRRLWRRLVKFNNIPDIPPAFNVK